MMSRGAVTGHGVARPSATRIVGVTAIALVAGLGAWMLAARPAGTSAAERAADRSLFAAETGVRPVHIALTGGGGLVDLRYQVIDADQAAAAHDPARPPSLIDEASGLPVDRSWMGHAHPRAFRAGTQYFELLVNPHGRLERGSEVTLVIGDSQLEHLRVE